MQVYEYEQDTLLEVMVAPDHALNAFYHPYAYAALTRRHCVDVPSASAL